MLADVLEYLSCPLCAGSLCAGSLCAGSPAPGGSGAVRCPSGHAFDVARQGYLNLLSGDARPRTGDSQAMVAARAEFLGAGHYAPITRAVTVAATELAGAAPGCVVDVGAGTGHHLGAVLDGLPDRVGIAVDVSKHAARRAARAHPRVGALVCDARRALPVRTAAAALVLDVFAPRNGSEIARLLHPDGALVVVTPTPRHLAEVMAPLDLLTVDPRKAERVDAALRPHLAPVGSTPLEFPMTLGAAAVTALVRMGPSAHHADPVVLGERISELPEPLTVTASVAVSVWRPVSGAPGSPGA